MNRRMLQVLGTSLLVFFLSAAPGIAQSVRVQIVDVGQGDGILIRTPHHQWVLIDAGPNRQLADSLVPQFGVDRLALVLVSHRHADHFAKMARVLRALPVDRFVGNLADCPNRSTDDSIRAALADRHIPAQSLGADTLTVDGVQFIVLPTDPNDDPCPGEENNNSVIVRMEYGAFSMLFTGDAEAEERDWLVAHHAALLDVDVLKASHHGGNNGTSPAWLAAATLLHESSWHDSSLWISGRPLHHQQAAQHHQVMRLRRHALLGYCFTHVPHMSRVTMLTIVFTIGP